MSVLYDFMPLPSKENDENRFYAFAFERKR